jgi:isopenicillin N synthase-like dioxygenase
LRALGKFLKPMGLEDEHLFVKAHSFMDDATIQTQAQFRTLNYYPLNPEDPLIPPNAIRFGEHTDWGTVTLLFQDLVGGLEVKRLNGTWIEAVPLKDSILINAGQLLELWSAGIFQATVFNII